MALIPWVNLSKIRCFNNNPGIQSSLTFLRRHEWARRQVEELYIRTLPKLRD
ncbi:VF530 family DNA-binding protein [Flavobacterium cyanobacteriorum]|uniref:VF530 family DNA-binding protein n=1 Tax=Flavobacterium cyanobacteriorum TaxID=2022802 RepID=UPI003743106B